MSDENKVGGLPRPRSALVADRFRLDRSTDGGVTWSEVHPQGEPLSRLLEGPFANTLFSGHGGPTGMTLRSDDAGATWHEPQLPPVHFYCRAFMAHPLPEHPGCVLGACA